MFVLIVQSGKHAGRRVKLPAGESIVGRDELAKVRIASSEVSRQHCRLIAAGTEVRVQDLSSRNGTYVDGVPIEGEAILRPGGTLTVGPMTFRLDGGASPSRRTADFRGQKDSEERAKQGLSDDEIISLLSDEIGAVTASDTTIHGDDSSVIPTFSAPPSKSAPRREFKSVADEAREIIRLHLASLETGAEEPRE